MTLMAMLRMIPYHIWKASHTLMGPLFLLSAFHTFFVASPLAVGAAPWALMAGVSIVGVIAWCQTLLRKLVPARLVEVERVIPFDGGVDVTFRSKKPMPKFQPGQLAMLSHKSLRAEAYPFTIAGGDEMVRRLSSVPLGIGPIILSPQLKLVISFALAAQWGGSCRRLTASEKNSFGSLVVLVSRRFCLPLSVCSQMLGPV